MRNNEITAIYNLVINKIPVDREEHILDEAKLWYKHIKLVGAKHVVVYYFDHADNLSRHDVRTEEVDMRVRAFAAFIMKMYYRWDDDNSMRLESHYGLTMKVSDILDMSKLTKDTENKEYTFVSIRQIIKNCLS